MHEQANTRTKTAGATLPPCCGTGCAVCVLDLIDEAVPTVEPPPVEQTTDVETVECCNTGCLICVRDYPELFCSGPATLQLLEAIEQAQQQSAEVACMTGAP